MVEEAAINCDAFAKSLVGSEELTYCKNDVDRGVFKKEPTD